MPTSSLFTVSDFFRMDRTMQVEDWFFDLMGRLSLDGLARSHSFGDDTLVSPFDGLGNL
jgi:hypothetical protein